MNKCYFRKKESDGRRGLSLRDKLRTLPTVPLNPFGDNYVRGEDGYQMIEVAKSATKSATSYLFKTFLPPEDIVNLMHSFVSGLAIVWRQSKGDESTKVFSISCAVREAIPIVRAEFGCPILEWRRQFALLRA